MSVDPLADYNPFYNSEHYIDGQHNGGVYNSGNLNPYIYTYQNPIKYVDPNGKQALAGAIMGAFTEYASKIGGKMLFDGMSFTDANKSLNKKDYLQIGIAGAVGSISGSAKFAKWISKLENQKILVKMIQTGLSAIEGILKESLEEDIDLQSVLISTLSDLGLGSLLSNTKISKQLDRYVKIEENNLKVIEKKLSKPKNANNSKLLQQKINQEIKLKSVREVKLIGESGNETLKKTVGGGFQEKYKNWRNKQ